jgi:hypothetical protein
VKGTVMFSKGDTEGSKYRSMKAAFSGIAPGRA